MKTENVQPELKRYQTIDTTVFVAEPKEEKSGELSVSIDLHDPNAPEACVLEKMSHHEKSWFGMLLKPLDMMYHLCDGAGEILSENYQQQITTTLQGVESILSETRKELLKVMSKEELTQFQQLYEASLNIKSQTLNIVDNTEKKAALIKSIDQQIEVMIENASIAPVNKRLLYIILQGCNLRTPLFMLQVAFATPTPEIPGGYSKTGLQFQLVIPSLEIFKNIFLDRSVDNIFIQPFLHLEGGISFKLKSDEIINLPISFQACATGMRVTHLGVNITLQKTAKGWQCARNEYIIEAVNRLEGHLAANKDLGEITPGLQLKLGGDTVRQFVFPCNTRGNIKFITHFALRAVGAVGLGALALCNGLGFPTAKAAGILGQDLAGSLLEMSGCVQPEKVVDIVELLTLGIDVALATTANAPLLGNFDVMLMNRLNGSYLVEHDKTRKPVKSATAKINNQGHQQIRRRKNIFALAAEKS